MAKQGEAEQPIQVIDGPQYRRDIERHPHAAKDVQKVLDKFVLPALRANPVQPHRFGAGTPIVQGLLKIRVPDSAGGTGKRGGFRLTYHWDRRTRRVTKLQLVKRRDA